MPLTFNEALAQEVALDAAPPLGSRPFSGGVSFGGLTAGRHQRSPAELARDAAAKVTRSAQITASPEGRFRAAAHLIFTATGDERLLNCASRGLDTNADFAAELLAAMEGPAAEACRAALAEFIGAAKLAAE